MISEKCKYSYYNNPNERISSPIHTSVDEIIKLFNTQKILSITGYYDGIAISANVDNMPISIPGGGRIMTVNRSFFSPYSYELVSKIWDMSFGINDIINTYLEHNCKSKEEMQTVFMAKVLGGK
jgi:hypothetical protein